MIKHCKVKVYSFVSLWETHSESAHGHCLGQGCPNSVLEGRCPAEFSSNPNIGIIIKYYPPYRPSRTEFGHPWSRGLCFQVHNSWHSLFFCWRLSNSVALLRRPLLDFAGELPVFVVRPHAPNRDVCTVTVQYEYMYHATPYTGAGHIIRISSKSWFISLIPFKKWNLYNVYIHSTQTDIFQVFIYFNVDDYNWQLMEISLPLVYASLHLLNYI